LLIIGQEGLVNKTMQKTIIKLEPRVEVTPSGATRTVYRRREYKPGHPDYEKESKLKEEYIKNNFIGRSE